MSLEKEPFVIRNVITQNNFGYAATWDTTILTKLITDPIDVKCVPFSNTKDIEIDISTSHLKRYYKFTYYI